MEMTFEQYISNPMGKNNAVLNANAREIMRKNYSAKFDNILLRENGKIEYHLYYDSKRNTYWAHIKVPSEVCKNFYYDVVLKFYADSGVEDGGKDLFKYKVNFYSNDPSFVYTYAHVFLKNGLFVKELSSKMSKEALRKQAKEKNPGNNVGYVKSLYFAYLIMKNKGLNKIIKFNGESKPLDAHYLLSQIENADDKIRKRQEEGEKYSKRKKIKVDKSTMNRMSKYIDSDSDLSRIQVKTTKKISSIQSKTSSKTIKSVKSTKKK